MDEYHNFTHNEEINGPVLATAITLEMVMSLVANSFILIFTLSHRESLKQPAIILLTNFVLGNLFMTIVYLPSVIVTSAAGEWVFGETFEEKVNTCKFFGYVLLQNIHFTTLCLTAISVDRFLFIVKPFIHKRYMKPQTAVAINVGVWILAALLSSTPLFGMGWFGFGEDSGSCVAAWPGHLDFVIFTIIVTVFFLTIIAITTMWTFCFTRKYVKHLNDITNQPHVYKTQIRKVIEIFGAIFLVNTICYLPGVFAALLWTILGDSKIPGQIYPTASFLFFLNYILNPIVQAFFRKEVKEFIVRCFKRLVDSCKGIFNLKNNEHVDKICSATKTL